MRRAALWAILWAILLLSAGTALGYLDPLL